MNEKERSYEPIRLLELALTLKKQKWLRKHGWIHSCDFIDSCWRWCKQIEGKLIMCNEAKAIHIELNFIQDVPTARKEIEDE